MHPPDRMIVATLGERHRARTVGEIWLYHRVPDETRGLGG
jgi:hypothetical protein